MNKSYKRHYAFLGLSKFVCRNLDITWNYLKRKIMKKYSALFALLSLAQLTFCQVPKKVIVEHFTNTKCSICATRNPGFYNNYTAQTGVIHLAIHPSSPYSACVFSQHNPLENDARTNYYGVYGGTPRLVIQGVVISSGSNYSSSSLFTPFLGQTSPASIKIEQSKYGNDSIRSRIVIKTEASHSLPVLSLFVALAEDTINYTGSNGESVHYDVFRKSLTGASGISITLPSTIGDSLVYTLSSPANTTWNFSRIFTLAILQESTTKAVVQTQNISANAATTSIGISTIKPYKSSFTVLIAENNIVVKQEKFTENNVISLYDLTGRILLQKALASSSENIPISELASGIYLYVIKSNELVTKTGKLFIP